MTKMEPVLAGRTIVVLGAAGQVGGLVTARLLQRGASVVAVSRREQRLEALASSLRQAGHDTGALTPAVGDLADLETAGALRDAVLRGPALSGRPLRRLDGVVAVLGGWSAGTPLTQLTLQQWQAVVRDNLTAHFVAARTFLPVLLDQGAGVYVPVSGPAGEIVRPGSGPVSVAVAGQRMLDRALVLETQGTGVAVEELVFSGSMRRPGWLDGDQLVDRVAALVLGLGTSSGARA